MHFDDWIAGEILFIVFYVDFREMSHKAKVVIHAKYMLKLRAMHRP